MGMFDVDNDIVAKLVAHKLGREPTEEELAESHKRQEDAINMASGVMGTVGKFPRLVGAAEGMAAKATPEAINVAEQTLPSMADRIKAAALNSKVRGPEGGLTNNSSMYQQGTPSGDAIINRFRQLKESLKK
jgi:hypothetical protein